MVKVDGYPRVAMRFYFSKMKCKKCKHFKVVYQPMMPYDSGLAKCEKHDLVCDFTSERKLNRLTCVEETVKEEE